MTRVPALTMLALLFPITAHADFWSDDAGRLNERLADFNHTFEIKTRGEVDRSGFEKAGLPGDSSYFTDSTHWPSYLCGGSVLPTITQNYYTTYYGKPSAVRLGLKKIKTIRCTFGAEKNLTISGDTMTITLDKTSGQNDPPMVAEAMLRIFPEVAWDGAEESIQDAVDKLNQSCGIAAKLSFDKPHVDAVSYAAHRQSAANACGEVVALINNGCRYNEKVKAAVQKVTSIVCTKGAERAMRLEPTRVTVMVPGYRENQPALDDDFMQAMFEKILPGSKKSWKW